MDLKADDKNIACCHVANYLNHTCSCSAPLNIFEAISTAAWLNLHALYDGTECTELERDFKTVSNYTFSASMRLMVSRL